MAIIYTYPRLVNLDNTDLLLISDSTSKRKPTMSVKLGDLATHIIVSQSAITGSGTISTIPFFNGNTTIASTGATYSTTGGGLAGNLPSFNFNNAGNADIGVQRVIAVDYFGDNLSISNISAGNTGVVTLKGDTEIGNSSTDALTVDATSSFESRVNINEATSSTNGIAFEHPAGGASSIVNMYYNGAAAGSRFVISRAATGGAEIELESDGDINLNRTGNGGVLIGGLGNYANDAAAAAGGVPINGLYRNGNNIQIRSSASGGYNSYVALLSTGFTPPAATVLSNNLTATLTWARTSQGTYTLTASAATFTNAKTIVFINPGSNIGTTITWTRDSDTVLTIRSYTSTGQLDDGIIADGAFEVRIYS